MVDSKWTNILIMLTDKYSEFNIKKVKILLLLIL